MHKKYEALLDTLINAGKKADANQFSQAQALLEQVGEQLSQTSLAEIGDGYYEGWGYYYKQYFELLKLRIATEQLGIAADVARGPDCQGWLWYYLQHQPAARVHELHQVLLKMARELLDGFMTEDKELLYSSSYLNLRAMFRAIYSLLGLEALAAGDIPLAVKEIEACFAIKSGYSEYLDPYTDYYQTKASLYQAAYSHDADSYRERYFAALMKLEKKADSEYYVTITNPLLQAQIVSPDYLAFQQEQPVERLRRGKPGETWQQALARFEAMREALELVPADEDEDYDEDDDEDDADWNRLTITAKETEAHLAEIESQIGCAIPASLRELLCNHGAFEMRDSDMWGSMRLYSNVNGAYMHTAKGLLASIDDTWGGRPEFDDYLKPAEVEALNRRFFCFGAYFHDDNFYTHYYFTREGRFGAIRYHQDEWNDMHDKLNALLADDTPGDFDTLDALLSSGVDDVIEAMVAWKEENDQEA